MKDFVEYILGEVKQRRLPKTDAIDLLSQFQSQDPPAGTGVLHPLVQQNTSVLAEQRFSSLLTGAEFFLNDHQIGRQRILPGTAYLEMAREAVMRSAGLAGGEAAGFTLKNMTWLKPVVVGGEPFALHMAVFTMENGEIGVEFYSENGVTPEEPITHSQGIAILKPASDPLTLDLPKLKTQFAPSELSRERHYAVFRDLGIDYGPSFQCVQEVYAKKGQVLARLVLPEALRETLDEYVLHPSLLDGAWQALLGLMVDNEPGTLALPFSLRELEIFGRCASQMWVLARHSDSDPIGNEAGSYDLDLCDADGRVCVRMKGLTVRNVGKTTFSAQAETEIVMLEPHWKHREVSAGLEIPDYDGHQVVFCGFEPAAAAIAALQSDGIVAQSWESEGRPGEQFTRYATRLFSEVQALLRQKPTRKVLFQVVVPLGLEPELNRGLAGILETARLENPSFIGQLILMHPEATVGDVVAILSENRNEPLTTQIRYAEGKRYIAELREIDPVTQSGILPWKNQGVYLITGGTGGLGMIMAEEIIAQTEEVAVILTGRSGLSAEKQISLEKLAKPGRTLSYHQVDVTDRQAVDGLMEVILNQYGKLDGIIHSAGIKMDNYIVDKSEADFRAVLAPKVLGLVNLDEASRSFDLDWIMVFGSGAGVLGNPGQVDYAAANAFMDSYAHYRNQLLTRGECQGRTLILDWMLWKDGGMQVADEWKAMMVKRKGITAISTANGIQALYRAWGSAKAQFLIAEGEPQRLRDALLGKTEPQTSGMDYDEPASSPAVVAQTTLPEEAVKDVIIAKIAEALKLSPKLVDVDSAFSDYGLDSISGVLAVELISNALKIELDPTSLFNYSSVNQLATYIITTFKVSIPAAVESKDLKMEPAPRTAFPEPMDIVPTRSPRRGARDMVGKDRLADPQPFVSAPTKEPIAIVGMSGRFAKSENVEELWRHLANGDDLVGEIARWDLSKVYAPESNYSNQGSFLETIDQFDPLFFKISGTEAAFLDPGQRLFLEEAWKALEDSGYAGAELKGRACGVYLGYGSGDYQRLFAYGAPDTPAQAFWGNAASVASARIAYYLDLKGPAITVDTACSSSLVAIHLACQGLWSGETELALAGGVFVQSTPMFHLASQRAEMLSKTGRCHTFDQKADGFVPGEGVGVVVVKRLKEALRDGDHIYGVIRGSGINQDGTTNGITAPSGNSQEQLIRNIYDTFNIDPDEIQMVEAHGTGTKLGDPIEFQALTKAFRHFTQQREYCAIGSIKTNIGHTITAAGIAGLFKILLGLKYHQIPPSLHFETGNSHIHFGASPFYVNTQLAEWQPGTKGRRCAAVSSFGFSGTNAHLVVEEAPVLNRVHAAKPGYLIVLSANTPQQLVQQAQQLLAYAEQTAAMDCGNVGFTLMMGRKHFTCRLAFVIQNRAEGIDILKSWLSQGKNRRVYQGELDEHDHREQPGLKNYGNQCLEKCQNATDEQEYRDLLTAIAELYVQGYALDFGGLYCDGNYSRVALPTYPFAKESYWLPHAPAATNFETTGRKGEGETVKLHPLVGRNVSTMAEEKFLTRLTGAEFYLRDHQIGGHMILPGAAYIEMMQAAGTIAGEKPVRRIKNLTWLKPLVMEGNHKELSIGLESSQEPDTIDFQVSSVDGAGKKVLHAQGSLGYDHPAMGQRTDEKVDFEAIRQRCRQKVDGVNIYARYWEEGFHLGKAFQVIQEMYTGAGEVFVSLQLPAELKQEFHHYQLHPVLLDGAFQAAVGLTLALDGPNSIKIPFAIGELEILGPLPSCCYVHLRAIEAQSVGGNLRVAIRMMDEAGTVVVRINDFMARPFLNQSALKPSEASEKRPRQSQTYGHPVWERVELSELAPVSGESDAGSIVIFDRQDALYERFKTESSLDGTGRVFLIKPGDRYRELGEGIYQISPGSAMDYHHLCQQMTLKSPVRVIHAWALDPPPTTDEQQITLQDRLDTGFYSVFELGRTLIQSRLDNPGQVEILYLYPGAPKEALPYHAALNGLAKAVALENNHLVIKALELEALGNPEPVTALYNLIRSEFQVADPSGTEISYRDGQRRVKKWRPFDLAPVGVESPAGPERLKANGVYLITGGMGGLGQIFATHLAKEYQGKLVLVGRSALDAKGQAKLDQLNAWGAEAVYIQCDISIPEAVHQLIADVKCRFQSLDGVIHCAGITRDALMVAKQRAELESVLAAKVFGTVNLDEATKTEKLDFFILFSSLTSVLGNIYQSDYAYANSFIDNFAEWRETLRHQQQRTGRTLAINWPLWRDGGMQVDLATQEYLKNMLGLDLLETAAGLQSFDAMLASAEIQVMVIPGEISQFESIFANQAAVMNPSLRSNRGQVELVTADSGDLVAIMRREVIKLVSEVAQIREDRINARRNLMEYGFDSLIMVELTNQITKKYQIPISPAVFFEYGSIEAFVQHLVQEFPDQLGRFYADSRPKKMAGTEGHMQIQSLPDDHWAGRQNHLRNLSRFNTLDTSAALPQQVDPSPLEPVAIIGMSGVMPQSEDLEEFWQHLQAGRDLITPVPEERRKKGKFDEVFAANQVPDLKVWGGFMKEIDKFDAGFFRISPREAELMDPKQRIMLETVWKTIEDAGYRPSTLWGSKTGMFIGASTNDYNDIVNQNDIKIEAHLTTGLSHAVLANRISFFFNFHGPSMPIDTACSSALIAVHQAVEAIRNGSCEMAIAGGVNALIAPNVFIGFNQAGMLSPDGHCKTFDESANGYVRGEGAGAVFLKPLRRALQDGDQIYAVIRSTAVNHCGNTGSLTAPSMMVQSELLIEAYEKAGIDPASVSYIEAHGTGTPLGDPIEVDGLKRAFQELFKRRGVTPRKGYCGIGSVKTNVGHLESAAGVSGLLKVLLALKHRQLPATVHYKNLNPYIRLENSPFYVVEETRFWDPVYDEANQPFPRRAGVSSFGFGGANAHIVLEEYLPNPLMDQDPVEEPQIVVLSARNVERLKAYAGKLLEFVTRHCSSLPETGGEEPHASRAYAAATADDDVQRGHRVRLQDLAYTLQIGREPMETRLAIIAVNLSELRGKLERYCRGELDIADCYSGGAGDSGSTVTEFFDDPDESREYLNVLVKNKKLAKLAKLWVLGVEVDWEEFHRQQVSHRISLPTYPFAREGYWLEDNRVLPLQPMGVVESVSADKQVPLEQHSWHDRIVQSEPGALKENLELYLSEQIAGVLKLNPDQSLEVTQPLVNLGLDSLMALQLKKQIESQLELDVSVIHFLGGESIADLVSMLLPNLDGQSGARCVSGNDGENATVADWQNDFVEGEL